jgi:hypothetical protein
VLLPACDDEPFTLGPSLPTGRGVVQRRGEDGRDAWPGTRGGYRPHAARLVLDSRVVPARGGALRGDSP